MALIASEARLAKSKARELETPAPPVPNKPPGICLPFNNTRLKSGPTPRTVTLEPSPSERSMDTPLIRCRDSARLVSGNLPMSSATIPSITPCESRFRFIDDMKLPRIPVTVTVSRVAGSACGGVPCAFPSFCALSCDQAGLANASNSADVRSFFFGTNTCFMDLPPRKFTNCTTRVCSGDSCHLCWRRIGRPIDSVVNFRVIFAFGCLKTLVFSLFRHLCNAAEIVFQSLGQQYSSTEIRFIFFYTRVHKHAGRTTRVWHAALFYLA